MNATANSKIVPERIKAKITKILAAGNVVVSTFHHSRELEWAECTVEEARELLDRKTVNGFRYSIPAWFGSTDDMDYELTWYLSREIRGLSPSKYPA